jgi:hypothetical protein
MNIDSSGLRSIRYVRTKPQRFAVSAESRAMAALL